MVQQALDRGYEVVGVCRERSVSNLWRSKAHHSHSRCGQTDRQVIQQAVAGCDGCSPAGPVGGSPVRDGNGQAVLDYARPKARLIFSCGWHITRDGQDVYPQSLKGREARRWLRRLTHIVDIDDQLEAWRRIFARDTRWMSLRGATSKRRESGLTGVE